jgi:hypothetical protein
MRVGFRPYESRAGSPVVVLVLAGRVDRIGGDDELVERHGHVSGFVVALHLQERLGHGTIGITMDIYSHVMPSMGREAATQPGAMLYSK